MAKFQNKKLLPIWPLMVVPKNQGHYTLYDLAFQFYKELIRASLNEPFEVVQSIDDYSIHPKIPISYRKSLGDLGIKNYLLEYQGEVYGSVSYTYKEDFIDNYSLIQLEGIVKKIVLDSIRPVELKPINIDENSLMRFNHSIKLVFSAKVTLKDAEYNLIMTFVLKAENSGLWMKVAS